MEEAVENSLKEFSTQLQTGLSSDEVQKRLREYGYNEVSEKRVSTAIRFVKKFWGITPWMLEPRILLNIASLISGGLKGAVSK